MPTHRSQMNRQSLFLTILVCALSDQCLAATAPVTLETVDTIMEPQVFRASNGMEMPYRMFQPINAEGKSLPLLVYLHGRGERGSDNNPKIILNTPLFTGEHSIISEKMQTDYPCYVLVPQCSDKTINEEWARWVGNTPETPFEGLNQEQGSYVMSDYASDSGAAALELIESILHEFPIDSDRVYLTGISMGGFGTWEFAGRRPDLFAAAAPMAGYSDPATLSKIAAIPFWIFHGEIDKWNPVQGSRNMAALLRKIGAEVKYTEYANTGHGETFQKAWNQNQVIPWLFSHRRTNKSE